MYGIMLRPYQLEIRRKKHRGNKGISTSQQSSSAAKIVALGDWVGKIAAFTEVFQATDQLG